MPPELAPVPSAPVDPPAPPAPAPEPAPEPAESDSWADTLGRLKPLDQMTREEREHWDAHGTLPAPAAPSAEPEPEPVPSGPDISRFIRTPPPPGVSKRQHERNELIRYATEAEQRVKDLEARSPQPAQPAPPQDTRQPEPPREYDGLDPADPKPARSAYDPLSEAYAGREDPYGEALTDYQLALWRWEQRRDQRVADYRAAVTKAQQELDTRVSGWRERRQAWETAHPQDAAAFGAFLNTIQVNTPMGDVILDSPVGTDLAWHLATHPAEMARIAGLHPRDQLRALGKLEATLETSRTPPASSDAPAVPASPKPSVSAAPPPPTTLGTRPAEPADDVAAAIARGDVRAFMAAEDRRDLERARTGI